VFFIGIDLYPLDNTNATVTGVIKDKLTSRNMLNDNTVASILRLTFGGFPPTMRAL